MVLPPPGEGPSGHLLRGSSGPGYEGAPRARRCSGGRPVLAVVGLPGCAWAPANHLRGGVPALDDVRPTS